MTSAPTLVSHPDGTTLGVWMSPDGFGQIYVDDMENPLPGGSVLVGGLRDPSAAFVSGPPDGSAEAAIVVSTQSFPTAAVQPWPPQPSDLALPAGLSLRNQASATQEIVMEIILKDEGGDCFRAPDQFHFVSENPSDPGPKAVDGRAAVAGDLNTGEALVAWVRYETPDFLIEDGLVTIYEKTPPGEICADRLSGDWCPTQKPNYRPQMEKTAIYVRKATINGPIGQRADSNADGRLDISDGVKVLKYLFAGAEEPPCLAAANSNGDNRLDISDGVSPLKYLFSGGAEPPAPFPECGTEPEPLGFGCESFAPCE